MGMGKLLFKSPKIAQAYDSGRFLASFWLARAGLRGQRLWHPR